jgi:HPt (histidine-containing phosphotransfer) domain-containing protein
MSLMDLNMSRLHDITGGDRELNGEVIRLVLEDAETAIGELVPALRVRNAAVGGTLAHQLKGASANVGAERLADAALRLERALDDDDWTTASRSFDEVLAALATLRDVAASLEAAGES